MAFPAAPPEFWWYVFAAFLALLPTEVTILWAIFRRLMPATRRTIHFFDAMTVEEQSALEEWAVAEARVRLGLRRAKAEEDELTRSVEETAIELERMGK